VYKIKKVKIVQDPTKGCRAIIIINSRNVALIMNITFAFAGSAFHHFTALVSAPLVLATNKRAP
jgi:hypothetical protein